MSPMSWIFKQHNLPASFLVAQTEHYSCQCESQHSDDPEPVPSSQLASLSQVTLSYPHFKKICNEVLYLFHLSPSELHVQPITVSTKRGFQKPRCPSLRATLHSAANSLQLTLPSSLWLLRRSHTWKPATVNWRCNFSFVLVSLFVLQYLTDSILCAWKRLVQRRGTRLVFDLGFHLRFRISTFLPKVVWFSCLSRWMLKQ